jgi:hypothetical protein
MPLSANTCGFALCEYLRQNPLAELGIDKKESSLDQKLAAMSDEQIQSTRQRQLVKEMFY